MDTEGRFDFAALRGKVETLRRVMDEIKVSYAPREGLERFLDAWRLAGLGPHDGEFLERWLSFLRSLAEKLIVVAHDVYAWRDLY